MHRLVKLSDRDGVERGFFLCKRKKGLVKGRTIIGEVDIIPDYLWEADDVQCPPGTLEMGSFHTHPNEKPYPSHMDVSVANYEKHSLSCIGGQRTVKCWDLLGKKYSKFLKPLKI